MSKQSDEMISKSLEEIDALVSQFTKTGDDTIAKGGAGNLQSGDVSAESEAPDEQDEDTEEGQEDDSTDQEADVDEDNEPEENEEEDEFEKSTTSDITSSDSVKKALEVSEFLRDLVTGISNVIESHTTELNKSLASNDSTQNLLAKSFEGIAKSQRVVLETQAELLKSMRTLGKRIKTLEDQPMVRKSVPSATTKVVEKSFAGAPNASAENKLTKSQAVQKLAEGIQGGRRDLMTDLLALEGTGSFDSLTNMGKQYLGL